MHPSQVPLPEDMRVLWLAALADADLPSNAPLLYLRDGQASDSGFSAVLFRPGDDVDADLLAGHGVEADVQAVNRVFVWTDRTIEGRVALVRHELEHVRQFSAYPNLHGLHQAAEDRMIKMVGGRAGSAALYQELPTEMDANAASAAFARATFGSGQIDQLVAARDDDSAALRSSLGPEPLATLPTRMRQFLADLPALCNRLIAQESEL